MDIELPSDVPEARLYQEELLDKAKEKNSLICLGTGAGKTYIAAMLISHYSHELELPYDESGKRTFFLVPTRPLVKQQALEIVKKTRFSENDVGEYTGDMNVDYWSKDEWLKHLRAKKVFVMTRQIFLNNLNTGAMPLAKVNLLIFDEAHHAAPKAKKKKKKETKDCYKLIMDYIHLRPKSEHPRILGLSASLINANSNVAALQQIIVDLEDTYESTCISVTDLDEVRKYATDPVELIWEYDNDAVILELSQLKEFLVSIQRIFSELKTYKPKLKKVNEQHEAARNGENEPTSTSIIVDLPISVDSFAKCEKNICQILESMGPWCAAEACNFYIREFQEFIDLYENSYPTFSIILTIVSNMIKTVADLIGYNFYVQRVSSEDIIFKFTSNKMERLLNLLMEYSDPNENLSGIIFVKQRAICKALCKWLQKLKEVNVKFDFLKTDYLVGEAGRPGFSNKIAVKAAQLQRETLNKFRRGDINLLVATSILEEGLDVSQCNLVVRYDGVDSYREWVQSQGRARSKDARFVVFSERESASATKESLTQFKTLSKELQTIATSAKRTHFPSLTTTGSISDDEMPLVNTITGARVTLDLAKQLVYMYCSRLPSDAFFVTNPLETLKETLHGFQIIIKLPINSPIREEIEGPIKQTESLAAKTAYLKVCRILRERDEIDESFVPYTRKARLQKIIEEFNLTCPIDDEEDILIDGPKPGTKKRQQIYIKSFEKMFATVPMRSSTAACVYAINVDPRTDGKSIGFICAQRIQLSNIVSSFPVFIKTAEFKISIVVVDTTITLSSQQLYQVQSFHQVVFHESLGFKSKQFKFDEASPLYVVPLNDKRDVDWTMINETLHRNNINNMRKDEDRKTFTFNKSDYVDALVYRLYDPVGLFEVLEVNAKTPSSRFPSNDNGYKTYVDYYIKKYGLEIIHTTIPLLTVDSIGFNSSIKRLQLTKAERKRKPIDLIPELLLIFPIPTSFHRQCRLLPAIFYRLSQMYNVEHLREWIASEGNFGWKRLPPDHHWGTLKFDCDESNCQDENKECNDDNDDANSSSDDGNEQTVMEIECESSESHYDEEHATPNQPAVVDIKSTNILPSNLHGDFSELKQKYSNFNVQEYAERMKKNLFQKYDELLQAPLSIFDPSNNSQYLSRNSGIMKEVAIDFNRVKSFDNHTDENDIIGPTPSLLLQAFTTTKAIDMFNMERLETLGDSFLKLTTSAYLYYKLPVLNEGYLSLLKVNQISNSNLYRLGKKKNFAEFIVAQQFQPSNSWLPPGFIVENSATEKKKRIDGKTYNKFTEQKISDKSIADCCEALIGAYLLSSGPQGAVNFMTWLGIRIKDPSTTSEAIQNGHHWLQSPRSAQVPSIDSEIKIKNLSATLTGFEEYIGYNFRDKCFLIQAMTHVSYHDNTVTDCYQRLEFLGDAVLDFLITRYIYEDPKRFSPGQLTDLRASLTNNAFFGSLAVKHKFHVHLKMNSYELYRSIHSFADKFNVNLNDVVRGNFMTLLDEHDAETVDDIDVPKALGDVFESVAGAIYLDSNYSLDAVWRVYYPLMKMELDEFRINIPKSPLSLLYIKFPKSVIFSQATTDKWNRVSVSVTVKYKDGTFTVNGLGQNLYWAKNSAAKRALKHKN